MYSLEGSWFAGCVGACLRSYCITLSNCWAPTSLWHTFEVFAFEFTSLRCAVECVSAWSWTLANGLLYERIPLHVTRLPRVSRGRSPTISLRRHGSASWAATAATSIPFKEHCHQSVKGAATAKSDWSGNEGSNNKWTRMPRSSSRASSRSRFSRCGIPSCMQHFLTGFSPKNV